MCEDSDTVASVKKKVAAAANQHCGNDKANEISADLLRLLKPDGSVLKEEDALQDCELNADDAVLHVVVQIADDEWEDVDVVSTELETGTSS